MKEVVKGLWVGNDADYEKVKDNSEWRVVRACKDGPGGHRDTLGYTTMGASKGEHYLFVEKPRRLALNLIDTDDPDFIPDPLVTKSLAYITHALGLGHKVLVACNHGKSRSPSLILLWLVFNGRLPFDGAVRKFKQLYPDYDPSPGIKIYTKQRIAARR